MSNPAVSFVCLPYWFHSEVWYIIAEVFILFYFYFTTISPLIFWPEAGKIIETYLSRISREVPYIRCGIWHLSTIQYSHTRVIIYAFMWWYDIIYVIRRSYQKPFQFPKKHQNQNFDAASELKGRGGQRTERHNSNKAIKQHTEKPLHFPSNAQKQNLTPPPSWKREVGKKQYCTTTRAIKQHKPWKKLQAVWYHGIGCWKQWNKGYCTIAGKDEE